MRSQILLQYIYMLKNIFLLSIWMTSLGSWKLMKNSPIYNQTDSIVQIVLLFMSCYCSCRVIVHVVLLFMTRYCSCRVTVHVVLLFMTRYCSWRVTVHVALLFMTRYYSCHVIVHDVLLFKLRGQTVLLFTAWSNCVTVHRHFFPFF